MALDLRSSELEHKFIKERVTSVEKHFSEISSKISEYLKKLAYLRNSGDELSKSISAYASKETYNQTLRLTLGEFSDVLSSVQEYRDAQAQRILVKVIHELDSYSPRCKQTKVEIKKCFDARQKELKKKTDLEKTRSKNPPNWQKITQAEKEVNQAQDDANRSMQELTRQVELFERKKIEDLKRVFLELIKIELIFHAKAIELFTKSYNIVKEINVEEDLQEFKSHFKAHTSSVDDEALSPHITIPKTVDTDTECMNHTWKPQSLKGVQGKSRSVFTLKTATANIENSSSSFESFIEQPKF